MGRGRQKAKHTKVARELKYFSPDTNYNALERELTHPVTGAPIDSSSRKTSRNGPNSARVLTLRMSPIFRTTNTSRTKTA